MLSFSTSFYTFFPLSSHNHSCTMISLFFSVLLLDDELDCIGGTCKGIFLPLDKC